MTDRIQLSEWHSLPVAEVLQRMDTSASGLIQIEAQQRSIRFGANRLKPAKGRHWLIRLFSQFHNVLIYLLLTASVITWVIVERIDSLVILGVVTVNALIGFIQEGKAETAINSLRNLLTLQTMVMREGKSLLIPSEELVPGDIVLLESGDKIPADVRILHSKSLKVDESLLTGESVPVEKQNQLVPAESALAERFCMAYSGTLVTYGTATGVVVGIADDTEIGRINKLLHSVSPVETPLLRQIDDFSRWLSLFILLFAALNLCLWLVHPAFTAGGFIHVRGRPGGSSDSGRFTGYHDDYAGDWRPKNGAAERHCPAFACRGNLGCDFGDLYG